MSLNHNAAREAVNQGFAATFGRPPTLPERQCVQAVGMLESAYGTAWKGAGVGSNNWGAIQYRTPSQLGLTAPYPPISPDGMGFLYTDTSPQSDGTSRPYSVYFRRYTTPTKGARDLVRVVYSVAGRKESVLARASAGDTWGVSEGLYRTRYYEGFGKTPADRIANHHKALSRCISAICRALGEPLPDGSLPPPPTLRRGISGEHVREWQRILGTVVVDGEFGPTTEAATKEWQAEHGLKADGIVGPRTWTAAETDLPETIPPAAPSLTLRVQGGPEEWAQLVQTITTAEIVR